MQLTLEKNYIAGKPVRVDDLGGQIFGGEANAHKFVITQYAAQGSAETIAITGSVSGTLMVSTGATVPLTGSLEDGKAVVVLDEDCYKVPGRFVLTIFVTSGDMTLCIYCAVGNVLRTSTDTVVYPTESLPNLAQLVDQVQAAIDSFPADLTAIQAAIAANYEDLTYPITAGTYAWHAGTLYKAKTDISAAESWTAAHWETVHAANDLATDISQLKSTIGYISDFDGVNLVDVYGGFKPNYYLDASGNEHYGTAWGITYEIPVNAGEEYVYDGVTATGGNARCFYYTASGTVDLSSEFFIVVPGAKLTIPSTAKFVRFSVNQNAGDLATFQFRKASGTLDKRLDATSMKVDSITDIWKTSLYDKTTNVSGYLDDSAVITSSNAWETSDFMPVASGLTYIYSGLTHVASDRSHCFYYDANKLPMMASKFIPNTGANKLNPPSGAYYIRFPINKNVGDINTFDFKLVNPSSGTGTTLEVSQDGTKPFKTINDAFKYAYAIQSAQNPVTILIYPGTYDEVVECTSANGSPYAWGAYVSFVGINKNDVIWRNDSGLYANSPLHTSNPGLIKGITFIATHDDNPTFEATYADHTQPSQQNYGAYGLHIDDPTNGATLTGEKFTTTVEDCIIISKQHAAIGIGLRVGQTLIVKNCDFYMEIPTALVNAIDSKKGAFLFHRIINNEPSLFQHLIIDNNNIYTNTGKVMYTYNDGGGIEVDAMRNMLWSDVNENSNSIINGATTMFTKKSFGNNIAALNKATIS